MDTFSLEQMYFLVQIFAGIAVVGSLIYVGLQLKQNTVALAASAQRDSSDSYIQLQQFMIQDNELLEIIMRSESKPDSLNELEKRRAWAVVDMVLEMCHSEFYRFKHSLLPDYAWEPITRVVHDLMAIQVYQEYWTARKHSYAHEFQAFVDNLITEGGTASWNR